MQEVKMKKKVFRERKYEEPKEEVKEVKEEKKEVKKRKATK